MQEKVYYLEHVSTENQPYIVKNRDKDNAVSGAFVCEIEAKDFAAYRNAMLEKHNDSLVTDYTDNQGVTVS
ncbi:MAG: hypothetical protein HRU20_25700 [Pseudomonadales bacterium]|nr:hypothetical protein [Pseudomonadales bacterium]